MSDLAGVRPEVFAVTRSLRGGAVVLSLGGELDLGGVADLRAAATEIPVGGRLVVDLGALDFMDCCGLRALISIDVRSRAEGWSLSCTRPRPAVARLLELTGFGDRVAVSAMLRQTSY